MRRNVQALKKRFLHQREQMETEMVKLSTKEHHYKSENEKDLDNELDMKANSNLLKVSEPSSRKIANHDDEKRKLHQGEDARERVLEEQVAKLKAEFAQEKAHIKEARISASPIEHTTLQWMHPAAMNKEKKKRSIEQIEEGYFKHNISAHEAREQMAHIVVVEQARKAAEALKKKLDSMHLKGARDRAAPQAAAPGPFAATGGTTAPETPAPAPQAITAPESTAKSAKSATAAAAAAAPVEMPAPASVSATATRAAERGVQREAGAQGDKASDAQLKAQLQVNKYINQYVVCVCVCLCL